MTNNSNLKKFKLKKNSYFQQTEIKSKEDIIRDRLDKYGDRIIVELPLDSIEVRPQVRKSFDRNAIEMLSKDIGSKGLLHPVTVMKHPNEKNQYILLIGGNRFEAFKTLNRTKIPCIVKEYTNNQIEIQLTQLAENMHRTDINTVELSDTLMDIKEKTGYTLEVLAQHIGRNIDSLKQYSRISKLSPEEKKFHIANKSSKNHILKYLATKEKEKKNKTKTKLTTTSKKIELNDLSIQKTGHEKDSIKELTQKIELAKKFIKEAEELLNSPQNKKNT